jgi:hypothetical protein
VNGDKFMAVDISAGPTVSAGTPHVLFTGRYALSPNGVTAYDISPDGRRFLKVQATEAELNLAQINVVINWFEELKRVTSHPR